MEILNQIKMEGQCENCHAELIVSRSDIKVTMFDDAYIKCPVCKSRLYLSDKQRNVFEI